MKLEDGEGRGPKQKGTMRFKTGMGLTGNYTAIEKQVVRCVVDHRLSKLGADS